MALEIERRFLVISDAWQSSVSSRYPIIQAYLAQNAQVNIRVRMIEAKAWLCVKSAGAGRSRQEFEYPIPAADARELIARSPARPIEKWRHEVMYAGHLWEVDVFEGANTGLIVAEIELEDPEEAFVLPGWAGLEVTEARKYSNASLALRPYSTW
jgi:adenylate cyclase